MAKKCPVMYAFNTDGHLIAIRCGSWTCPHCMKINARHWAWRVNLHVTFARKPAYFWTFTLPRRVKTAKQGYAELTKLWDRLRKYIARNLSEKWEYCAFVEGQPLRGGMPHFHVISMSKSPKRIKDIAVWCGFGYEAKEKRVDGPGAASYVAKYASKQGDEVPKGFRRVRASQGWSKLPNKEGASLIVRASKESLQQYLERVADMTGVPLDSLVDIWLKQKYLGEAFSRINTPENEEGYLPAEVDTY